MRFDISDICVPPMWIAKIIYSDGTATVNLDAGTYDSSTVDLDNISEVYLYYYVA